MKFVPKTVLTITSVAVFTLATAMIAGVSLAAPNPPPPSSPPPPPGTPIDSGIIVLMGFAVILGLYKIYQIQKKKAQI